MKKQLTTQEIKMYASLYNLEVNQRALKREESAYLNTIKFIFKILVTIIPIVLADLGYNMAKMGNSITNIGGTFIESFVSISILVSVVIFIILTRNIFKLLKQMDDDIEKKGNYETKMNASVVIWSISMVSVIITYLIHNLDYFEYTLAQLIMLLMIYIYIFIVFVILFKFSDERIVTLNELSWMSQFEKMLLEIQVAAHKNSAGFRKRNIRNIMLLKEADTNIKYVQLVAFYPKDLGITYKKSNKKIKFHFYKKNTKIYDHLLSLKVSPIITVEMREYLIGDDVLIDCKKNLRWYYFWYGFILKKDIELWTNPNNYFDIVDKVSINKTYDIFGGRMIDREQVVEKLKNLKLKEEFNKAGLNNCLQILEYINNGGKIIDYQFDKKYIYQKDKGTIKKDLDNLLKADIISDEGDGLYIIKEEYTM